MNKNTLKRIDTVDENSISVYNENNKECIGIWKVKTTKHDMASCMLAILDYLKAQDSCYDQKDLLKLNDETLSEMMFRKMKGYGIDLNKELGVTHLKPIIKK